MRINHYFLIKVLALGVFGGYFIYNMPFILNINVSLDGWKSYFLSQDGLYLPVFRSVILAFAQTVLILSLSFIISLFLFQIKFKSSESKFLGLLLIPIILGNVSVSFLFKLLLSNNQWIFENIYFKFISLTCIQFWQYGSLFIYLFWLNQSIIVKSVWDYANSVKLNDYEKIKDIIVPKQKNLSLLLFIVAYIFCYYEDSKVQFIFKASRGTNTELINQWLNRTYNSDSLINANFAFAHLSQAAFYVLLIGLVTLIVSLYIYYKVLEFWLKKRQTFDLRLLPANWLSKLVTYLLFFWIFTPIAFGFYTQWTVLQVTIWDLISTLGLSTLAAFTATSVAVFFSIMSRLAWQKVLASFNSSSLLFLIVVFSLILIPPITLLILGFKWMQVVGYSSSINIYIAWVIGHTLLSFPVLASFSTATHFRVKNSFIQYLDVHKVSLSEKIRDLFVLPFQADYFLTFLLAFAMIWNEGAINNILSDIIPSFATELNKTITGKAADYSNGMNYFLVSLTLALSCANLWSFILYRHQNNQMQA